jgi:hypothetical protein
LVLSAAGESVTWLKHSTIPPQGVLLVYAVEVTMQEVGLVVIKILLPHLPLFQTLILAVNRLLDHTLCIFRTPFLSSRPVGSKESRYSLMRALAWSCAPSPPHSPLPPLSSNFNPYKNIVLLFPCH